MHMFSICSSEHFKLVSKVSSYPIAEYGLSGSSFGRGAALATQVVLMNRNRRFDRVRPHRRSRFSLSKWVSWRVWNSFLFRLLKGPRALLRFKWSLCLFIWSIQLYFSRRCPNMEGSEQSHTLVVWHFPMKMFCFKLGPLSNRSGTL